MQTIESWLRDALAYYKPLGFFSHYQGEESAVVRALHKQLVETSSDTITAEDLATPEFDLFERQHLHLRLLQAKEESPFEQLCG